MCERDAIFEIYFWRHIIACGHFGSSFSVFTLLFLYSLDGGELFDRLLQFNFDPTELDVVVYMKQICEAVAYLHKNQILHLDLKPGLP